MARPIKHWHKYRYDEALGKWIRKKRYKHPVITLIKLDPDQALIAACQSGGAYVNLTLTDWCVRRSAGHFECGRAVRDRRADGWHIGGTGTSAPAT